MRGISSPLSQFEETTLRKVAAGDEDSLDPRHVRRLVQLDLIEWDGARWGLTPTGRRRHDSLFSGGGLNSGA